MWNRGFVRNGSRVAVSVLVNDDGAKFEAIAFFLVLWCCRSFARVGPRRVRASSREWRVVSLIDSHLPHFYNPRDSSCNDSPPNSAADGASMISSCLACLRVRLFFQDLLISFDVSSGHLY